MKKSILIIVCLFITIIVHAQVSKTVNVTAGGLYSALSITERNTVTNLTVTGVIDASDFKTMRDYMPVLTVLDLSGTSIVAYTGPLGTNLFPQNNISYLANTIPSRALFNCTKLTSFSFPSSVISIDDNAFNNCTGLTSVTIPSSVISIKGYAFNNCSGLISVAIPSSVTSIGEYAFYKCGGLTAISIPSSIITLGNYSFGWCIKLTSITIPSSVTSIGEYAFYACSGLTSITIPPSVTFIGKYCFAGCNSLISIILPSSVTSIEESTFSGCVELTSVTIPSSITSIGLYAFYNCSALSTIYVSSITPVALDSWLVFQNVNLLTCILYVPLGSVNAYRAATVWKDFRNIEGFTPTNLEFNSLQKISIYPNPFTNGLYVTGLNEISLLSIFDLNGKLIFKKKIQSNEYVSVKSLISGVYFINITSGNKNLKMKVLKVNYQ